MFFISFFFFRSLFVVLDSLNNQDGSVSASAQNWLVRALSLSDVVRILEPVLLLLLDPRTQRSPIQSVKQNLSVGMESKHTKTHTPDKYSQRYLSLSLGVSFFFLIKFSFKLYGNYNTVQTGLYLYI